MNIFKTAHSSTRDEDSLAQNDGFVSEKALFLKNNEFDRVSSTKNSLINNVRLLLSKTYEEDFLKSATTKRVSLKNQTE